MSMKTKIKIHAPIVYQLYDFLKECHMGEENAISARNLSELFGVSERALRDLISEIRESSVLQLVIGSNNKGYFVCRESEFERTNNRLKAAAFSLLKVAYANDKKAAKDGQMRIRFSKYAKDTFEAFARDEKAKTQK